MSSGGGSKPRTPRKSALAASATPDVHRGNSNASAADANTATSDLSDPLSPAFDPNRLKVAELRSLLFQHDVHVPSSARKPALVEAYEHNVRANADELRAERNRDLNVRPDGRGIVYLSNGQVQRSPGGDASDSETATSHGRARGRRSVSWAESVGSEEEAEEPDFSADVSSFSMENPFQSTSNSPAKAHKAPRASEPAKRPASASKKRTSTSRRSLPSSKAAQTVDDEDEDAKADSSLQSYQSSPASPLVQKQKRMRQWVDHAKEDDDGDKRQKTEGVGISNLFSLACTIVVAAWWVWFTSESKAIGFCDTSKSSNALLDGRAADRAERYLRNRAEGKSEAIARLHFPTVMQPSCTLCPAHALCSQGELKRCESTDYILHYPMLRHVPLVRNMLPLWSIAPSCDPDEERLLLAADLAEEIENRLRTWKADVYCNRQRARLGPRDEPDWGQEGVYALPLSDMYHDLKTAADRGIVLRGQSPDFFRELWDLAMTDLEASGRVQQRSSRLLAMRGPAGVGLSCRIRLATASIWRRLRFWLTAILMVGLAVQWLRSRLRGTSEMQRKAKDLVDVTLDRLQSAKQRHVNSLAGTGSASPSATAEPYLSTAQLRDLVLRHEGKAPLRKALWARVSKVVEANTNVRTRQAKVHGEWARVWEWVGPLDGPDREMVQRPRPSLGSNSSQTTEQDERGRWGAAHGLSKREEENDEVQANDYNAGHGRRRPSADI